MELEFESPKDIFDQNAITKIPLINDDFIEWIQYVLDMAPKNYGIDLDVSFLKMDGYDSNSLKQVFLKNSLLELKRIKKKASRMNRIAITLIIFGVTLLILTILLTGLWNSEDVVKQVVCYVLDIATTVTIWEAMTILVIDSA